MGKDNKPDNANENPEYNKTETPITPEQPNFITPKPPSNQSCTYYPNYKYNYQEEKKYPIWRKIFNKKSIQIIATLLNLLALLAFIYFGNKQASQTQSALAKADISNSYTKNSIDYTRKTDSINKRNDSVDRVRAQIESEISYDMANTSIGVSKKSMENSIESSQADLRPFLWYNNNVIDGTPEVGEYTPSVIVKNFGRSPAFNGNIKWDILCFPKRFLPIMNNDDGNSADGAPFLPPGVESEVHLMDFGGKNFTITKELLDSLKTGKSILYINLQMSYDQYIGKNVIVYTTTFFLYYDFLTETFQYTPTSNNDTWKKKNKNASERRTPFQVKEVRVSL